jgi:hypothetical protein
MAGAEDEREDALDEEEGPDEDDEQPPLPPDYLDPKPMDPTGR